jgi:hypothetical protein
VLELRFHTGGNETILGIDRHVPPFEVFHLAARALQQRGLEMVAVSLMCMDGLPRFPDGCDPRCGQTFERHLDDGTVEQVTLTQGHADLFLGLRYAVTDAFSVDGGYSFTYYAQHEISGEDNNEILFLGHGFGLNLAYRF